MALMVAAEYWDQAHCQYAYRYVARQAGRLTMLQIDMYAILRSLKDLLHSLDNSWISAAMDVHVDEASCIRLTGAPVGAGSVLGMKMRYKRIQLAR